MSWSLKPFWKSKAWEQSRENRTGFFSWGDSDYAKGLDVWWQGAGTAIDAGLDAITQTPATPSNNINTKDAVNMASFASNNQLALYGLIGLIAYKVFFK